LEAVKFTAKIPGDPVGKGRPRFDPRSRRTYTPAVTRRWERLASLVIGNAAANAAWDVPAGVPVRVTVLAVKARPKRLSRRSDPRDRIWRTTRPDADNVAKAALDAAQAAGVLHDDAQVASLDARSLYSAIDEEPAVWVTMEVLDAYEESA
jgi:Holliday junction resolvase RusA-like endonuclease